MEHHNQRPAWLEKLLEQNFILLDGAMGTMLQKAGLPLGALPETYNVTHPDQVREIHRQYKEAGANILYANTFGANRHKLAGSGYSPRELIAAGISLAKEAAEEEAFVAVDIGPIGALLEPAGSLSFQEAYDIFAEQAAAAQEAGAHLAVIETMTDLNEARAALLAVKETTALPVFCSMTFEETGRTFTGCSIPCMALTLEGLGADAVGINCSLGPDKLPPLVEELSRWTRLPILVKPNAGLPDPNSQEYDISPSEFAGYLKALVPFGIKLAGGCCGTTPEYLRQLAETLKTQSYRHPRFQPQTAVCSASACVAIDRPRIIGERINPTGKKRFQQALREEDMGYILTQALQQTGAGAEILDVNVGLPQIDEPRMMVKVVKALQGITDAPLQLDSSDPKALEAGLRAYCGKAIVNSVNGEESSLSAILPLVKRYGAAVVGLTLDENGIPKTARERVEIAKRILNRALSLGIPREDVLIDCLTLTASAEQEAAYETLTALRQVKEELGLKTVLGVSNISFGLPNRELVNHTFLTLALAHGLDLPILNPNVASMTGAVNAYWLLRNIDKGAAHFVSVYGGEHSQAGTPAPAAQAPASDLAGAVEQGLKEEAGRLARELLQTQDPLELVNRQLIPALDRVGAKFESGKLFLPQLIQSANAAQAAFEAIKAHLSAADSPSVSRGTIVIATVKGDIHDIGKNIVKVLLENYGYTVIDLGRDVPPEEIADAAIRHGAGLVGLSALMTTTLKSMEATIRLLQERNVPAKVMVGGAVLTPQYAKEIGADYYAKDAKESCDIAARVFEG